MLILNIKQMTSVFVDDSGSPLIDSRGNILLLEGKTEYVQCITNAFKTLKYSESFMPPYGFDLQAIMQAPAYIDKATQIRAAALECLNPSYIKGLLEVNYVVVRVEDQTATIDLSFLAEDNETYTHKYTFEVGE